MFLNTHSKADFLTFAIPGVSSLVTKKNVAKVKTKLILINYLHIAILHNLFLLFDRIFQNFKIEKKIIS